METESRITGFLLFCWGEFIKIVIIHYWPQKIKVEHIKVKMPAYWEMSHADLLKLAGKQGVLSKVKLKKGLIAELVELSR